MSTPFTDNLGVVPARKTLFGQEPAFWTMFVQALLVLLVSFGLNLSQMQTGAIIAVVNGVLGVILAFATRPINIGVFVTLFQVLFTLIATFGLDVTTEQIGSATAFLGLILFLFVRQQVVPLTTLKLGQTETQPGLPAGVLPRAGIRHLFCTSGSTTPCSFEKGKTGGRPGQGEDAVE